MDNYLVLLQNYVTEYGIKIIGAVLVLIIGLWATKLVTRIFKKMLVRKEFDPTLTVFFTTMVRVILVTLVIIAAISQAGIETISFVAILGSAGLAIGLALQGSLSNFASGVMLIIFRPIKIGDYIEAAGVKGTVEEIGIFITILNSPDNKVIYVPNSKITSDHITNYNIKNRRRVDLVFGIGYKEDIDKARTAIMEVLNQNSRILDEPQPVVKLIELADSSVNFVVRPWCKTEDYWNVYFEVMEAVKKKFDAENIEIPFPQRDVHLHQN